MFLRAVVIWLALVAIAIANGVARNSVIVPRIGEHAGHVISTIILCAIITLIALASICWIGPGDARQAFLIGILWVALTTAFEFIAGHYVFGHPWAKLLADYNILRGRLWLLVLATTLLSPMWAFKVRGA